MVQIVGVNRETVVSMRRTPAGFEYGSSGTAMARCPWRWRWCPGSRLIYAEESHGNLASSPRIIEAIVDLIARAPPAGWPRGARRNRWRKSASTMRELRAHDAGKIDWRCLDSAAARGGDGRSRRPGRAHTRLGRFARLNPVPTRRQPGPSVRQMQGFCPNAMYFPGAAAFLPNISHIAAPSRGNITFHRIAGP